MTKAGPSRSRKSAAGDRRRGKRAGAKKRARQRARAARPKQKPKRTAKTNSRARRAAATVEKRAATGRSSGAGTAKKRAVRPATKRKPAPSRPRAPKPPPPPAFPQATGAPVKHQVLFRMVRARASVLAAIQGMSAADAERPLAEGKWSTRETILHLVTRDRARLREMEAALRGVRPSWEGIDEADQARVNEADLTPLRHLAWEDAVRLLSTTRQRLMEEVESVPEEPAEVWGDAHPFGWMLHRLPPHDLHHADAIKRRRIAPAG